MLHVCCPPVAGEFGVERGPGFGGKPPGKGKESRMKQCGRQDGGLELPSATSTVISDQ